MKCPKCGSELKYRVTFLDDDNKGTFYIREDGSRNSNKKIKWYDKYEDALYDEKNNIPCMYPYFQDTECVCRKCNKIVTTSGIVERKKRKQTNKEQLRDEIISELNELNTTYTWEYRKKFLLNEFCTFYEEDYYYIKFGSGRGLDFLLPFVLPLKLTSKIIKYFELATLDKQNTSGENEDNE